MAEDAKIKNVLLRGNYVSKEDLKKAEDYGLKNHSSYLDYLKDNQLITDKLLGQAAAESFGLKFADLETNMPSAEQVKKLPEELAKKYRAILFQLASSSAIIATDKPEATGLSEAMKKALKVDHIDIYYANPQNIDDVLVLYRKKLDTRFQRILKHKDRFAPEIIEEIFKDALDFRASDIHFEPREAETIIRFRIDGVLQEAGRIPNEYYNNILNKIKVMAHMRIDEHFDAQDGAIRYKGEDSFVEMRVSIVPTVEGEKITIRLLAHYIRDFALSELGLSAPDLKIVEEAAAKPFGMILVVGPTGSGKTTTLYSVLKIVDRPEVNITTIEDPVEYRVDNINQIQVNPETELTFAKGLRSIVRQDPDIILVGEIRDNETAEISVNAALTGHLLLSTFHANDAATAVPRLLDMKIEPFLLSSTIELIMAQRLVRRICDKCKHSVSKPINEIEKILPSATKYFKGKDITLYAGKGCDACKNTGFKGRVALFELISVTPEIKELILKNPSSNEIWKVAQKNGARSMFLDGIEKVTSGTTTLEEVLRVANKPE